MHKRKQPFVDTAEKAKERVAQRVKLQEIQDKEARQAKLEEAIRQKNRKLGQLTIFDAGTVTTLSQFTKKRRRG